MKRSRLPLVALCWVTAWASTSLAEPRFALREGMRCADCHINRTGGGMRTPFGVAFSQSNLSTYRLPSVFDPYAGQSIALGANLRLVNRTVLAAHTSLQGVDRSSPTSNSFDIQEGNLYLRFEPIAKHLLLYIDETVTPEAASSREAFVMWHGLPLNGYIKAGRFLLPYGLRLPDDTAFIRQETGFTYASPDLGVEAGFSVSSFEFVVAVTNGNSGGNDPNLAKQITTQAAFVSDAFRAGASFAFNDSSSADFDFHTFTSGGHVGFRLGRWVAMAELDWIRGVGSADRYNQLALYVESNFEVLKGLYARFMFEAFDPLLSLDENERDRFIGGISWFPMPMLEVRAEFRVNRDIPQRVNGNADQLVIELHGFL